MLYAVYYRIATPYSQLQIAVCGYFGTSNADGRSAVAYKGDEH